MRNTVNQHSKYNKGVNDEEVVSLVQKGEKAKFGIIVDRYEKKLERYIRRLTNQPQEEVEDLLQEVLIRTYENIQDFDGGKKFSSWIYRIAHNKSVDFIKKRKFKSRIIGEGEEETLEVKEKLMEELMAEEEEKKRVTEALEKLEWKYREVLLLFYFEDKSQEEISEILRTSVANIKVMIYRGKEKLRRLL